MKHLWFALLLMTCSVGLMAIDRELGFYGGILDSGDSSFEKYYDSGELYGITYVKVKSDTWSQEWRFDYFNQSGSHYPHGSTWGYDQVLRGRSELTIMTLAWTFRVQRRSTRPFSPYAGAGFHLTYIDEDEWYTALREGETEPRHIHESAGDLDVGLHFVAGLDITLHPHWKLFIEGRYLMNSAISDAGATDSLNAPTIDLWNVTAGWRYHF